jgi:hypothetical protein
MVPTSKSNGFVPDWLRLMRLDIYKNSTILISMNSTTLEQVVKLPSLLTSPMKEYLGKVNITAQATYDRWPEASGMRGNLWKLAVSAGVSSDQYDYDQQHANINCDGGRW